ncbi:hypothetical protein GRF29_164g273455 [Pseudopithomyces chartarum]|uniref:Uncharacterized protein n=1 Tax=Pseudopithomyces chartarum TaxID=1892770 RepID=A0AAN6RDK5_9PLEO|nr:hypothetical protein GRF29_164g273455 [Pseudopithomyces chartarum]
MPIYLPPQAVRNNSTAMQSIQNQIQYRMLQIAHYGQPTIEIELDESQHEASRAITSYSTMDTIQGKVHVTAQHDTKFREIEISFAGTAQVFVERLSTTPSMTGRTEAAHKFLTLKMPINPADLPSPPSSAQTTNTPSPSPSPSPLNSSQNHGTFFLPPTQTPFSHLHTPQPPRRRLRLRPRHTPPPPPSLGDPSLSGFGSILLDDLSPEMAKITYAVRARVLAWHEAEHRIALLGQTLRKLRVKPVFEEQPPLNVDGNKDFRPSARGADARCGRCGDEGEGGAEVRSSGRRMRTPWVGLAEDGDQGVDVLCVVAEGEFPVEKLPRDGSYPGRVHGCDSPVYAPLGAYLPVDEARGGGEPHDGRCGEERQRDLGLLHPLIFPQRTHPPPLLLLHGRRLLHGLHPRSHHPPSQQKFPPHFPLLPRIPIVCARHGDQRQSEGRRRERVERQGADPGLCRGECDGDGEREGEEGGGEDGEDRGGGGRGGV